MHRPVRTDRGVQVLQADEIKSADVRDRATAATPDNYPDALLGESASTSSLSPSSFRFVSSYSLTHALCSMPVRFLSAAEASTAESSCDAQHLPLRRCSTTCTSRGSRNFPSRMCRWFSPSSSLGWRVEEGACHGCCCGGGTAACIHASVRLAFAPLRLVPCDCDCRHPVMEHANDAAGANGSAVTVTARAARDRADIQAVNCAASSCAARGAANQAALCVADLFFASNAGGWITFVSTLKRFPV